MCNFCECFVCANAQKYEDRIKNETEIDEWSQGYTRHRFSRVGKIPPTLVPPPGQGIRAIRSKMVFVLSNGDSIYFTRNSMSDFVGPGARDERDGRTARPAGCRSEAYKYYRYYGRAGNRLWRVGPKGFWRARVFSNVFIYFFLMGFRTADEAAARRPAAT